MLGSMMVGIHNKSGCILAVQCAAWLWIMLSGHLFKGVYHLSKTIRRLSAKPLEAATCDCVGHMQVYCLLNWYPFIRIMTLRNRIPQNTTKYANYANYPSLLNEPAMPPTRGTEIPPSRYSLLGLSLPPLFQIN